MSATLNTPRLNPSHSFVERITIQRREALQRANQVRGRRAALKCDLKAGRCSAVALIADPPDWAHAMKVLDVVIAMPKVGPVKAAKLLSATVISAHKTLQGLSPRQRAALIEALRTPAMSLPEPGHGGDHHEGRAA